VALLDLDRFQRVNDSLGHTFGDGLLVAVAKRIEGALRPGDVVGRLAGDEFALLIEGVYGVEDASHVALRVRDDLARPFVIAGTETFLSATMGVAVWSERYVRCEDLLRDASTALHEAASQGRNQSEVFHEGMRAHVVSALELETGLRRALERDEFVLHFQPIVSLASGLTEGFEALVRWNHPERGLVYPGEFIPLAEETRLVHALGRLVRRRASEQLHSWRSEARGAEGLFMSINASGREFAEPELAREVRALLRTYRLPPSAIHIEITETILVDGDPRVAATLSRLRDLGTALDIDDFGTGFSSLSYLQQIPASTLKIDRSFIARLGAGGRGEAVVETILSLARSLGLAVVAEGVETEPQLTALQRLGCHSVQGYLLARPVPAEKAVDYIGVPMLAAFPSDSLTTLR
jgi:diguanylate cyclase (GGDEF)-like protein